MTDEDYKERVRRWRKAAYQRAKALRKEYEASPQYQAQKAAAKSLEKAKRQKLNAKVKEQRRMEKKAKIAAKEKKQPQLNFHDLKLVEVDSSTGDLVPMKTPKPKLTLILSD